MADNWRAIRHSIIMNNSKSSGFYNFVVQSKTVRDCGFSFDLELQDDIQAKTVACLWVMGSFDLVKVHKDDRHICSLERRPLDSIDDLPLFGRRNTAAN